MDRNRSFDVKIAAILLALSILLMSALGITGGLVSSRLLKEAGGGNLTAHKTAFTQTASDAVTVGNGNMTVPQIAALTANSVVEITTETVTTSVFMEQYISEGAGSGVIVTGDGYIVTNNHVIDNANKITVRLKNGKTYAGTLVGKDRKTDIAVVKISATDLQPAVFGDSKKLTVGELAIAIGNPLGELGGTVTNGIISALDREIEIGDETMNLLQTNAAINPGNSGGGLFNGKGELVGIVNAKSSGSGIEGLGFAIPINDVKQAISDLIKFGYVQGRIDFGMDFVSIENAQTAMMYRVSYTGLYVKSVADNSNAESAGFESGDRIVSFNGTPVSDLADFNKAADGCKVGETVSLTVYRNGRKVDLKLKLAQEKS